MSQTACRAAARAFVPALIFVPLVSLTTAGGACAETAVAPGQAGVSEVIVVGRSDQPITVEPRGLSVSLGQTEFEAINAINVEDLMKYAPNFFVRKRYIGDQNGVPGFRGTHSVQSARSLIMVDGFVVSNFLGNSFSFPPKWGVVGPGEVRQFDIVYGPYSSRYIGNSMGGVVSITSRDSEEDEAFATAQVFTQPYKQYGTDDSYEGYSFEGGVGGRRGPWSGRISYRRLDNIGHPMQFSHLTAATGAAPATVVTGAVIDSATIQPTPVYGAFATDHTIQDQVRARIGYDFGNDWKALGLFVLWNTDSDQTDPQSYLRTAAGAPFLEGRVSFNGQTYTANGLTMTLGDRREMLAGLKLTGPLAGWDFTGAVSHYWIDRLRTRASSGFLTGLSNGAGTYSDQGATGWWTGDFTLERAFGDHELAVGVNANLYETDQTSFNVANWKRVTSPTFLARTAGKTDLVGVFIEDKIDIAEAVTLTLGLRYDRWRAYDGLVGRPVAGAAATRRYDDRKDDAVSPKVSVQWDITPNWHAQLSLATATRFPTVGELFQGRLDTLGNFDPNSFDPNLKAESSRDANFILRRSFDRLRLTGSVFYQRVEDAIFIVQGFNQNGLVTSSYKNIDVVRQYGVELIAEASDVVIENLDVDVNLAWIDAVTVKNRALPISEGVQFPRIPRWRVNGNVRYGVTDNVKLSLGFRYASRPNTNLEGTQRGDTWGYTSEFLIIDARATWDVNDHVQASVGVDNLNNDKAWVFHPYPQRTWSLELKWKM